MLVATESLRNPIIRRTEIKVTAVKKRSVVGYAYKTTIELGTVRPGGQVRWTNVNKLRRSMLKEEMAAVETQVISMLRKLTLKQQAKTD